MPKLIAGLALVATLIFGLYAHMNSDISPTTGALIEPKAPRVIPSATLRPMLELGDKTKLFMSEDSYLFGSPSSSKNTIMDSGRASGYEIGIGREIEHATGSRMLGEVSYVTGAQPDGTTNHDKPQTVLSATYLKQLSNYSDIRAGLSTDIASQRAWSSLELQLSIELKDGFSLTLHHDHGKELDGRMREHQTGIALDKRF